MTKDTLSGKQKRYGCRDPLDVNSTPISMKRCSLAGIRHTPNEMPFGNLGHEFRELIETYSRLREAKRIEQQVVFA